MTPPDEDRPRLGLRLRAAWLALLWERLAAALWLPLTVGGLALALALSDLLPRLPGWLHALLLGVGGLALFAALVRGLGGFRWPTAGEARHRLEQRAPHRPLTALDDRPARDPDGPEDPLSAALWRAHVRRMAEDARHLHAAWPDPVVPRRDPWGLRVAAALALILAGAGAWQAPGERLARAFSPALGGPAQPPTVDVWVTPPDYTGVAPLYRASGGEAAPAPITAPEGSALLVLIHGGDDPEVSYGEQEATPETLADGSHRLETTLQATEGETRLVVEDGVLDAAAWPLTVRPDQPPLAAFAAPPAEAGRWKLKVPLRAEDDYGIATATFHFRRPDAPADARPLPLPAEGTAGPGVAVAPLLDLAAHPWAGLPVEAWVAVEDALGQEGRTETVRLTLPRREFKHPVAARIAALRRELVADPARRLAVAPALHEIAQAPDAFDHDIVVYMGLRLAGNRLIFGEAGERAQVVDLLWNLALRVEEGDLADADRALAEAERALDEALSGDASPEEIQEKVEALRQALRRYMQAMMEQMPEMGEMPRLPPEAMAAQDLEAMLQQLGDLGQLGARDAAQAMLDQMRQMLSSLREARPMPSQAMQQLQQMMRDLSALTRAQEELLNRTFRDHRDAFQTRDGAPGRRSEFLPPLLDGSRIAPTEPGVGTPPAKPAPPGQDDEAGQAPPGDLTAGARLAEEQEALRRRLRDLLEQLGQGPGAAGAPPRGLGTAAQRMRDAAEALAGEAWGPATEAQGAALEALRQGQGQAMQSLMQGLGAGMALMPGGGTGGRSDPMGRTPGGIEAHGVKIPTDAAASRARDIMMELRRRSNDRQRPAEERDYIRRLLERF